MFALKRFIFILPIGIFAALLFIAVSPGSPMAATLHYSCSTPLRGGSSSGTKTYSTRSECESALSQTSKYCTAYCTGDGYGTTPGYPQSDPEAERRRREEEERRKRAQELLKQQLKEAEQEEERMVEGVGKSAEEERIKKEKKEEEESEAVEKARKEASETLKGVTPVPLGQKGEVRELGIKAVSPSRETRDVDTAMKQLNCARYLSRKASEAAGRGDLDEANYLSEQSAQSLAGGSVGVACPDAKASGVKPPKPKDVETYKKFYDRVNRAVEQQIRILKNIDIMINGNQRRMEEAGQEISRMKERLKELSLARHDTADAEVLKQVEEEIDRTESLLGKAKEELAKANSELESTMKERRKGEDAVKNYGAMAQDVEKNPGNLEKYLGEFRD